MKSRRFALGLGLALVACNGTTPPPAVPGAGAVVADDDPGSSVIAAGETFDTSPVPEPGAVVFHLRWRSPRASFEAAARYAQVPPNVMAEYSREAVRGAVQEVLSRQVEVPAFSDVVALDAPVDVVLIADVSRGGQVPEPIVAVSVGLTSLERALAASKGRPSKIGNGMWRIGTQDKYGEPCAVVAAAGKAPGRLVCAESDSQLTKVAPFLARNVATLPDPPTDLRAKLDLRPILDKYGRSWANQARGLPVIAEEIKIGIPAFDEALMVAADALAQEAGALIQDADAMVIDAGFDENKGLDLALELQFAGKRSWLVQTMVDGADKAGPPPELFWKLPATSATASYGHSGDPALLAPVLKNARVLLEGFLEREKFGTAADRQALSKLLRLPWGKHVTVVSASGHFDKPSAPMPSLIGDVLGQSFGWYVMGFDEPSAKLRAYLDDMQKAYNRPALQKLLKEELDGDAQHLPVVKTVPPPRAIGAGGYDLMIKIPGLEEPSTDPSAAPKKVDVEAHILLMSDGNQSWLGFGVDRDALAEVMGKLKGSGQGATLAGRPALAGLKNTQHTGATIVTLDGMVGSLKPIAAAMAASGAGAEASQVLNALEQMPNKGASPVVTVVDVKDGAKPRFSVKTNVPKGTLQDLGFLVTKWLEISQPAP